MPSRRRWPVFATSANPPRRRTASTTLKIRIIATDRSTHGPTKTCMTR